MSKKRLSPFSREFWIAKGMTQEQAEYKRNSIRPIRKEYWIERGYSESDAIRLAKEKKDSNNKRGAKKSASRSKEELRESSIRCVEYWIKRGYDEAEANKKVSESQAVFSLEKCIEKHGYDKGYDIWKKRQEKWLNSLYDKTDDEIKEMHQNHNAIIMKKDESVDCVISRLKETRGIDLYKTVDEFIESLISKSPSTICCPYNVFVKRHLKKIQAEIFIKLGIDYESIIRQRLIDGIVLNKQGRYQHCRMHVKEGFLRSSFEIYFYEKFKEKYPNRNIEIDNQYPDSNFRYDFLIDGEYIEIAPMYNNDDNYTKKMDHKRNVFGCVILKTIDDIDNYIDAL